MNVWVLFIVLAFSDGELGHVDPIEFNSIQECESTRLSFRPANVAHNFEPDQGVVRWKSVCIEIKRGPKEEKL